MIGEAEAGSMVTIYADEACSATPLGMGAPLMRSLQESP